MIIRAKKSLGQNFIFDEIYLDKISDLINSNKENIIIEIGSGPGTLTGRLLSKNYKKIILIEKDRRFIKNLEIICYGKNAKILNEDALHFNFQDSNITNSIIVGNLPFNISVELLYNWTKVNKWPPKQNKMILMFQKEVANRIIANPNCKSYGKLSVVIQSRYKIKELLKVPSEVFTPSPKVDATILELTPHSDYQAIDINKIDMVAKTAFSQRRKKIKNTMRAYTEVMKKLSIDENLRPEDLLVSDYCKIASIG